MSKDVDTTDPNNVKRKPYAFFVGGDGMNLILKNGKNNVLETLLFIGYTRAWIEDQLLVKKNTFYLFVDHSKEGVLATWENVF